MTPKTARFPKVLIYIGEHLSEFFEILRIIDQNAVFREIFEEITRNSGDFRRNHETASKSRMTQE